MKTKFHIKYSLVIRFCIILSPLFHIELKKFSTFKLCCQDFDLLFNHPTKIPPIKPPKCADKEMPSDDCGNSPFNMDCKYPSSNMAKHDKPK